MMFLALFTSDRLLFGSLFSHLHFLESHVGHRVACIAFFDPLVVRQHIFLDNGVHFLVADVEILLEVLSHIAQ